MSVAGNLKDFFNAFYLGNQETKRDLLLRYIEFFNPEKHKWNIEHFAWQAIDNLSS
jgi:ribosomal protein S15P/S13E